MELFLDTADLATIKELLPTGLISGITTNPSLLRKQFPNCPSDNPDAAIMAFYEELFKVYSDIIRGSYIKFPIVSMQIYSEGINDDHRVIEERMLHVIGVVDKIYQLSLDYLAQINLSDHSLKIPKDHLLAVKIPLTQASLSACRKIKSMNCSLFHNVIPKVNVTLCFSLNQALMAALAGADFVSVFVGRLEDRGENGMQVVANIAEAFKKYKLDCRVLVASVRNAQHIHDSVLVGADIATLPTKIFKELYYHDLTDAGVEKFCNDWAKN